MRPRPGDQPRRRHKQETHESMEATMLQRGEMGGTSRMTGRIRGGRSKGGTNAGRMGRSRGDRRVPAERVEGPARVRARGGLPPGSPRRLPRAGGHLRDPGDRESDPHRPPHDHDGHPVAGRDHQGQRLVEGECGPLLPGARSQPGRSRGGELPLRHLPDSRSSTSTPSRGASRWCRWRSSSSTCPRRCDG